MESWFYWLMAGMLMAILEIITPGFVLVCFAFGCFGASVIAALDFNFTVQVAVFSAITFVVFVAARPLFVDLLGNRRREARTNVDRLIGAVGITVDEVDHLRGWVKIDGDIWNSRSMEKSVPPGTMVRVLRVEGNKLIVTPDGANHS